jgi:cleavage and polyadenylation specificity factor subunit 3
MAAAFPEKDQLVSGVLVVKDFQYTIMDISDLEEFAGLQTTAVVQRQVVPYHASFGLLKYHLRQMFGKIQELERDINKRSSVRVRRVPFHGVLIPRYASLLSISESFYSWLDNRCLIQ